MWFGAQILPALRRDRQFGDKGLRVRGKDMLRHPEKPVCIAQDTRCITKFCIAFLLQKLFSYTECVKHRDFFLIMTA